MISSGIAFAAETRSRRVMRRFEASLHTLAAGPRKDHSYDPVALDMHAASVRFIESQGDIIADVRKSQGANLPALKAEVDRVDEFLGAQWRNPSVYLSR
jgi:hypothetical protein